MMRSLSIAKTGLEAQQTQLDAITHNLANVGTNGYKRSRAVFEDLLYQNIRQSGAPSSQETQLPTGLQLGSGVRTVATSRNFSQGSLTQTGNQISVAISRKSAAELGLNASETAAYSAIYEALGTDDDIGDSFLAINEPVSYTHLTLPTKA